MVWIWTNGAHCVRTSFLPDNISETSYDTSLILNFDVDWIVRIYRTAIWHWSLRTTACTSLTGYTTHLTRGLENLLAASSTTSIHRIIHHSSLV